MEHYKKEGDETVEEEELFTGELFESLPIETKNPAGLPSYSHNLPQEAYDYIYGEKVVPSTTEQPKPSIDIKEFLKKIILGKLVQKDYDLTIDPMDIKLDEKGELTVGEFTGKIKTNQNKKTSQEKPEPEEDEILF